MRLRNGEEALRRGQQICRKSEAVATIGGYQITGRCTEIDRNEIAVNIETEGVAVGVEDARLKTPETRCLVGR